MLRFMANEGCSLERLVKLAQSSLTLLLTASSESHIEDVCPAELVESTKISGAPG
jgi:hypothetical protein